MIGRIADPCPHTGRGSYDVRCGHYGERKVLRYGPHIRGSRKARNTRTDRGYDRVPATSHEKELHVSIAPEMPNPDRGLAAVAHWVHRYPLTASREIRKLTQELREAESAETVAYKLAILRGSNLNPNIDRGIK